MAATSTDSYKAIYDDNGKALTPQLRRCLGELSQDEIYFRDRSTGQNTADHYQKLKVSEAVSRVPDEIYYSFAVEVGGQQQIVSQMIPAGSVR
ncbi:hypothetical protein V7796_35340 [Rhizobium laguerreae]